MAWHLALAKVSQKYFPQPFFSVKLFSYIYLNLKTKDHDPWRKSKRIDPKSANEYLFYHKWNMGNHEYKNTWLNLNVYSERDKEEHDLRAELGY